MFYHMFYQCFISAAKTAYTEETPKRGNPKKSRKGDPKKKYDIPLARWCSAY